MRKDSHSASCGRVPSLLRSLRIRRAPCVVGAVMGVALLVVMDTSADGPASAKSGHEPYVKRECESCHLDPEGAALKHPEGGLCLGSCHEGFLDDDEFRHGPLNLGDCSPCHHYHESTHPHLLLEEVGALCTSCHPRIELSLEDHGDGSRAVECVHCHDPHGEANRFFVRSDPSKAER